MSSNYCDVLFMFWITVTAQNPEESANIFGYVAILVQRLIGNLANSLPNLLMFGKGMLTPKPCIFLFENLILF